MRYYLARTILCVLMALIVSIGINNAQNQPNHGSEQAYIKRAYRQLSLYQAAQKRRERSEEGKPVENGDLLRFTISNIRSGSINAVLSESMIRLVTQPSGRILRLTKKNFSHTHHERDGKKTETESFGVAARWRDGKYVSGQDGSVTLGEVLKLFPDKFPNLTKYISYEVTVTFEGKTRTYNALALQSQQKTHFIDGITSPSEILNTVLETKKAPVESKKQVSRSLTNRSVTFLEASYIPPPP